MPEVNELTLILNGECIETTARSELNLLIRKSIEEDVEEELLSKIELLKNFIEATDFKLLRVNRPELDGRIKCRVVIKRTTGNKFKIYILNQP